MHLVTDDQMSSITAALQNCTDGQARALQPSDPTDAAAIKSLLELSGKTPQTHPGLYADLERLAGQPAGPDQHENQVLDIVDSGRDASGRATARVWHQDRAGDFTSGSLALVLDTESGRPLALGHANRVGGGLAPAATRTESAQPATPTMTTVGFGHSQASPEADPVFGLTSRTTSVGAAGDGSMIDATVTAPVTTKGHSAVQIGLGRLTGGVDLDYFFVQDTNNQPALVVPFTGSVNTQQPLANVDSNGQFTSGLTLDTKLYSLKGVSYIQHNSSQSINTQVTGNTSTNVVSWNYPYDPNDPPNAYTSLMYGALAAANDSLTAFYFAFGIPVANPVAPVFQFNVCSYDWPDQPSVYCKQILDLQFWWHCLAEGTLVTLADGSTLEIEKVDNTKRVRTGSGTGSLAVEATTRGLHHTVAPDHPVTGVYRLSTAGGHQLILTGGHPVATPAGLIRASDLEVGDEVLTADGVDEVAELALDDFDRVFANLKLIDHGDRARGLTTAVGTFVANGIVVGDFESLTQLHYNNTHTLEYMTARIPERYHTDYESTLAAIASDNVRYGGHF